MVRYEWDTQKDRTNIRDHGISFQDAEIVFEDPDVMFEANRVVDGELRLHAIGSVDGIVLILVVHTVRYEEETDVIIRIISARKAEPVEKRRYRAQFTKGR
jgi:uncharacterized DUF497 family protein